MHNKVNDDQLRDLLYRQLKAVREDTFQAGGQVPAEQMESLERLARFVEICDAAQPPARNRWPISILLGITLLIVSLLFFARVPETEIELDIAVSEISFVLPTKQVLANIVRISALGVVGLHKITLPHTHDREQQTLTASESAALGIQVSVASDGQRKGTVNLAPLVLPAESRIWLRYTEVPHKYRLALQSVELDLRVYVNGPVQVGLSRQPAETLNFLSPGLITLQPDSNEVDMDLTFSGASQAVFSPQLSVNELSFVRIEAFIDTSRTIVRHVSTVLSGTLYLESLNGQKHTLRSGERIHFKSSRGEIRTLRLHDNQIALKYHGRVRGMSTGSDENRRSLMPTCLEWLRARHGLSLLWGTVLYLFGLIIGVLRWWRKTV